MCEQVSLQDSWSATTYDCTSRGHERALLSEQLMWRHCNPTRSMLESRQTQHVCSIVTSHKLKTAAGSQIAALSSRLPQKLKALQDQGCKPKPQPQEW